MNTPISDLGTSVSHVSQKQEGGTSTTRHPALGTSVSADLEALRNDVDQAKLLACDYQQQLAQQSNDHATLKLLFEKTRDDLLRLQSGITQLREERHQFANDAMKAAALELRLERVTRERDALKDEIQARHVRALAADERIAQLTREVEWLKRGTGVSAASSPPAPPPPPIAKPVDNRPAEYITVPFSEVHAEDITIVPNEASYLSGARKLKR